MPEDVLRNDTAGADCGIKLVERGIYMPTIEEILSAAKEAGASDVHLTVGIPPKMRVNGNLITMNYPRMLPADTLDVLLSIMTEPQRDRKSVV